MLKNWFLISIYLLNFLHIIISSPSKLTHLNKNDVLLYNDGYRNNNDDKIKNVVRRVETLTAGDIKNMNRIILGYNASENQFPWHASVIGTLDNGLQQLCGGSIISNKWILTAAHCVLSMLSIKIGLGSIDLTLPTLQYIIDVTNDEHSVYIHSNYNSVNKTNDIALIKLPEVISFSDNIKSIELPQANSNDCPNEDTYTNAIGIVSGFGRLSDESNVVSRILQWVGVRVIENNECTYIFGRDVIVPSTLCAIGEDRQEQNVCGGDSGGALAITDSCGRHIQIGVIAFVAQNQCSVGYPAGYMRITSYIEWINEIITGNS